MKRWVLTCWLLITALGARAQQQEVKTEKAVGYLNFEQLKLASDILELNRYAFDLKCMHGK